MRKTLLAICMIILLAIMVAADEVQTITVDGNTVKITDLTADQLAKPEIIKQIKDLKEIETSKLAKALGVSKISFEDGALGTKIDENGLITLPSGGSIHKEKLQGKAVMIRTDRIIIEEGSGAGTKTITLDGKWMDNEIDFKDGKIALGEEGKFGVWDQTKDFSASRFSDDVVQLEAQKGVVGGRVIESKGISAMLITQRDGNFALTAVDCTEPVQLRSEDGTMRAYIAKGSKYYEMPDRVGINIADPNAASKIIWADSETILHEVRSKSDMILLKEDGRFVRAVYNPSFSDTHLPTGNIGAVYEESDTGDSGKSIVLRRVTSNKDLSVTFGDSPSEGLGADVWVDGADAKVDRSSLLDGQYVRIYGTTKGVHVTEDDYRVIDLPADDYDPAKARAETIDLVGENRKITIDEDGSYHLVTEKNTATGKDQEDDLTDEEDAQVAPTKKSKAVAQGLLEIPKEINWPVNYEGGIPKGGKAFGASRDGGARSHQGIDLPMEEGSPIYAGVNGVISKIYDTELGGNKIELISSDNTGLKLVHAHLDPDIPVEVGDKVTPDTVIGYVGHTGTSWHGPHDHFETRILVGSTWVARNPLYQLKDLKPHS